MAALAAWTTASLRGGASADNVTDAAANVGLRRIRTAADCEHLVLALADLRLAGFHCARLLLPAPGDLLGLPGPAALNQRALAAGAAIVITDGTAVPQQQCLVLIPGHEPDWALHRVPLSPAVVAAWPTLRQARADFATGVAGHATALTDLDVAADARGLRQQVLGEDEQPLPPLPPGISDERQELLGRARLVAILAATAADDDGAAVSAAEASSRSAHLRSLSAIARRAIAASVSGP